MWRERSRADAPRPFPRRLGAAGVPPTPVRAAAQGADLRAPRATSSCARASGSRSSSSSRTCTGSTRAPRSSSSSLAGRARTSAVLLVQHAARAPWRGSAGRRETIALEGLGRRRRRGDGPGAPRRARGVGAAASRCSSKRGGNPLYVEEIVRQLQETEGIVVEDGEARLRAPT